MLTAVVGHLLAVCIGLSLGLIGGGGSILAVPILVYVMEIESKAAIAMSLVIVGSVSLIGSVPHWLQGNVNLKTALVFTPAAMIGAFFGAKLTALPFISDTFQLICFGIVMVLASILMICKSNRQPLPSPDTNLDGKKTSHHWLAIPAEGLGVGILTGLVGVGGGFLIIPALVLLIGLPMQEAVGTSLIIITTNSAAGFLGYLNQVTLNWQLVFSFTAAASIGVLAGNYFGRFVNAKHLQRGFGYFVLVVATYVLIRR